MKRGRTGAAVALVAALATGGAFAQGFRFSDQDDTAAREAAARDGRIAENLSVPCRADLKNKKIMVVIGERQSNGFVEAHQQNYGPHYQAINRRLQALGLRTYTPEEIRRQIAQAEIDAYFRNDPDAALSASKRLAAQYILRGLITTHASRNPLVNVNQVSIRMDFTLTAANGRTVSQVDARNESYSGRDTSGMALTLINERADEVVGQLYSDYCLKAGIR